MNVFTWMDDQLLRMQWLSDLVTVGVQAIGLDPASRIGGSVQFFVYDVIKIFILLSVLIFVISYIQSYFPPERTRRILGGRSGIGANILGALPGTITPFCSCSSIPLFIGFTAAGLPIGVTFSFLISSPLVDMASVILLASIFSWPVALAYVAVGLLVAIIGGTLIGKLGMEDQVAGSVRNVPVMDADEGLSRAERVGFARDQVRDIVHKVWPCVLIGVGIGAAIHNWVPSETISALLGQDKWWAVPVATLVGMSALDVIETLRNAPAHMVLVYDEYGHFDGIITPMDVLEAITGEFPEAGEAESKIVTRDDGSLYVSGWMPVDEFAERIGLNLEKDRDYETVAGLVLEKMGTLPKVGEHLDPGGWRIEVVDLAAAGSTSS